MLLQKKGADIWTHRLYKRLKSVKHSVQFCTSFRVSANMRNASLEGQIWTCQHANVAVDAPPSILIFIFSKKNEFMFLAWWLESLYHDKMFPDALCPQHHLTVHSDQLVRSGKGLATCPRGRSWPMSEGKKRSVKSQKLLRPRLHGGPSSSCCRPRSKTWGR